MIFNSLRRVRRYLFALCTATRLTCRRGLATWLQHQTGGLKPARFGAGGTPASASTLRTVVAETATPSPLNSPTIRRSSSARVLLREPED
jgi:hypothetical protein